MHFKGGESCQPDTESAAGCRTAARSGAAESRHYARAQPDLLAAAGHRRHPEAGLAAGVDWRWTSFAGNGAESSCQRPGAAGQPAAAYPASKFSGGNGGGGKKSKTTKERQTANFGLGSPGQPRDAIVRNCIFVQLAVLYPDVELPAL